MGFRNMPAYVQRQMDIILDGLQFSKAYIDDIVIASRTFEDHMTHLRQTFARLVEYNIAIKGKTCFIGYPSATVLGRRVDSFGLSTTEEKLAAIEKLSFPRTAKDLETYLGTENRRRPRRATEGIIRNRPRIHKPYFTGSP